MTTIFMAARSLRQVWVPNDVSTESRLSKSPSLSVPTARTDELGRMEQTGDAARN